MPGTVQDRGPCATPWSGILWMATTNILTTRPAERYCRTDYEALGLQRVSWRHLASTLEPSPRDCTSAPLEQVADFRPAHPQAARCPPLSAICFSPAGLGERRPCVYSPPSIAAAASPLATCSPTACPAALHSTYASEGTTIWRTGSGGPPSARRQGHDAPLPRAFM